MPVITLIVILVLAIIIFLSVTAFFIQKMDWPSRKKKLVFSFGVSALIFPVLLPAGTISAIPMPNIVLLAVSLADFEFLQIFQWYARTITFTGISYLVTLAIIGLISQVIFFEHKRDINGR